MQPCGYTMKISSRYHRLLIYDVKRTNKIDGMGPFNDAPLNQLTYSKEPLCLISGHLCHPHGPDARREQFPIQHLCIEP